MAENICFFNKVLHLVSALYHSKSVFFWVTAKFLVSLHADSGFRKIFFPRFFVVGVFGCFEVKDLLFFVSGTICLKNVTFFVL